MDLQARSATPLRLVLDKLVWRLRYIKKLLPAPVHRKIQLLWPLAFASVFWCAGVAAPNSSVLDSIQTETLNVFTSSFTHEVPAFLKHVLLGWHISPQFLQDFTALRRAALFETLRPLWLDDAPLTQEAASWMALLPQARDVLQRHGWTALPHEQGFSKTDALGRRRDFHFGHTSLRVLRQWLEEAFVSQGVHKCGRVREGFSKARPCVCWGFRPSQTPENGNLQLCGPQGMPSCARKDSHLRERQLWQEPATGASIARCRSRRPSFACVASWSPLERISRGPAHKLQRTARPPPWTSRRIVLQSAFSRPRWRPTLRRLRPVTMKGLSFVLTSWLWCKIAPVTQASARCVA